MSSIDTHLTQTGEEVQQILNYVQSLGVATDEEDGLMSKEDKARLDDDVADTPITNEEILEIVNS